MTSTKTPPKVCEHDMVYGQEAGDWERKAYQMKCLKCGYQSYMFSRPEFFIDEVENDQA